MGLPKGSYVLPFWVRHGFFGKGLQDTTQKGTTLEAGVRLNGRMPAIWGTKPPQKSSNSKVFGHLAVYRNNGKENENHYLGLWV